MENLNRRNDGKKEGGRLVMDWKMAANGERKEEKIRLGGK